MKKLMVFLCLLATAVQAFAQQNITGKVTDSNGEPVGWAAVFIKGTTNGTSADDNGNFTLTVKDGNAVIVVSSIGYKDKEVTLSGRTRIDVVLEPDSEFIDNAVVIGYGSVRKKDLTGAVSSIKSESISDKVMFSVDDALKGGVAGLMVSSTSGQPGAASKMLIRGANSLSGSTSPLIVVDGFPLGDVSTSSGMGMGNLDSKMSGLSLINTEDIESIEVLKDASATAIYGNRGSNGVILITTKKGRDSNGRIQYSGYVSAQQLPSKYDMLSFPEYVNFMQVNNPSNDLFTDTKNDAPRVFNSAVQSMDWQDQIYRTGFIQSHNLSMQNSTDKTNFLVSGSYMQNESIIICTNWTKFTAKASVDHNFTNRFRVGFDINFSRIVDDGVPTAGGNGTAIGTVMGALLAAPFVMDESTQSYFRAAGIEQDKLKNYITSYKENPVTMANDIKLNKVLNRTIINGYAQYNILDDLAVKVTAGYDNYGLNESQFYPKSTPRGYLYNSQGYLANVASGSIINENTITWSPTYGKHRINAVAGVTEQMFKYSFSGIEASDFENETLGYHNLDMAKDFKGSSNTNTNTYLSFIARANYSYDDRYIATFTFRRDGTSVFIKNKWGNFYSGALAWNASEEDFLKGNHTVSNLRVRLSAGEVGNANVPTSGSYAQLYSTGYTFDKDLSIGQAPASLANENLTWEKTLEYNLGVELGMFDNRLNFNLDLYDKTTRDLLLEAPVLNISGYTKAWQNIGKLRNRGIEFSMNADIVNRKDFKWSFNANASRNWSKILELGQNGAPIYLGITCVGGNNGVILREGGSIGELFGYRAIGLYTYDEFNSYFDPAQDKDVYTLKPGIPSQGVGEQPGSLKLWDKSGPEGKPDGKITDIDREVIGNFLPDIYGAFSTTLTYKDFDLYLAFQYSIGNDIYNANYHQIAEYSGMSYNQTAKWLDRYTETNKESHYYSQIPHNLVSSAFVEDASYLRFATARLSYSLPRNLLRKVKHIDNCKFYVSGDNLLLFTRYSGYDPEVGISQNNASAILSQGFDYGNFPHARTVTFGVNVSFK